jgi:hypothetical protein
MGDVHCNVYHLTSKVHKLSFLQGSTLTNDGPILLTIKGKWFEAIVHMTKFEFLNLVRPKQVQFLVPIMFVVNFNCCSLLPLLDSKNTYKNLSQKKKQIRVLRGCCFND